MQKKLNMAVAFVVGVAISAAMVLYGVPWIAGLWVWLTR